MYIEKVLISLSSAREKWGQKQKCCVYNFGQCVYIYTHTQTCMHTNIVSDLVKENC